MKATNSIDGRLRLSGLLVFLGLLVEAVCLLWNRPIAFVAFLGVGGALVGAGVLLYLYALATEKQKP